MLALYLSSDYLFLLSVEMVESEKTEPVAIKVVVVEVAAAAEKIIQ